LQKVQCQMIIHIRWCCKECDNAYGYGIDDEMHRRHDMDGKMIIWMKKSRTNIVVNLSHLGFTKEETQQ
jgi:hypothetical protein